MSDALFALLGTAGFAVAFPALWSGVTWLMGIVSGWSRLASRYRTDGRAEVTVLSAGSARIGGAAYNNMLQVGIQPEGLRLSVWRIFRPGHPPLLIPWSDITDIEETRSLLGTRNRLRIRDAPTTITLGASAVDAIREAVMDARAAELDAETEGESAPRDGARSAVGGG